MRIKALLFLLLFPVSFLSVAQTNTFILKTSNATVSLTGDVAGWLKNYKDKTTGTPVQVWLHFSTSPFGEQNFSFDQDGIHLLSYVSDNTWSAIIYPQVNINAPFLSILKHIAEVKPEWKASDYLWQNAKTSNETDVIVSLNKQAAVTDIESRIKALGGAIQQSELESLKIYKINLPSNQLKTLAGWYQVLYISPCPADEPLNFESRTTSKSNIAALPVIYGGYGLTGAGVSIGVGDNTSGITHIDLKDRVINYNPTPYTNHGVHINGIVGAAGIVDPKGEGNAPGATLIDHLYSAVWEQTAAMHDAHNMTITNNSYANVIGSCTYAGTYDVSSQAVDETALAYKDVLHVFAAGNDGYLKCAPFPDGFATVNGGYQPAKNNIVVTSTTKRYINASDGGRGPVKDGRLKPELTAVGIDVNSTTRSEEYLIASGTSMACPGVAGSLGLLTERYRQLIGNVNPRADLLKTLLLNGATDIGNPGPDYRFGFGFMNVYHSLRMLDSNRYTPGIIGNGGQHTIIIPVPPNTAKLKVMICWHDTVGNPTAAKALVNDLDLEVHEPSGTIHMPLVLDPTPANILNNAVEGVDRLNNCEQVTINNPAPGTDTAIIKGFSIPTGSQYYILAYDYIPYGVQLTYPTTGAKVKASDSLLVYWDASDGSNSFTLEFSTDNGNNWNTIDNNIPADQRYYVWKLVPANTSSGKCKMRLSRNGTGETFTSGSFAINPQPVLQLDAVQCPGYIHVKWDAVPNATAYKMFRKVGPHMTEITTTTATDYSFSGLSLDSFYYVAMSPVLDGLTGYRSLAIKRRPNDGNCAGSISDGDLMIEKITHPNTGRRFTTSALLANEDIAVLVRNLDDAPNNHYRISYSINSGPWQSQDYNTPIAANSSTTRTLANINMAAAGAYDIKTAIQDLLLPDVVPQNDTVVKTVRQLDNDAITLPFTDGFESVPAITSIVNLQGLSPDDHWDYTHSTDTGRFRSFVNKGITLNGNRSISMDAYKATPDNQNDLTGTFNMLNYNAAIDEVRMEFSYLLHGRPKFTEGNEVWVRGDDTKPWQRIYAYNTGITGHMQNTGSLSVTDGLQQAGQEFSSSFQVKIGQHDSSVIASKGYGNGMTIDDFTLYTVQNDLQLLSVLSPQNIVCGAGNAEPVTIAIRNGVNQALNNVQLNYRFDNGAVVTETIALIDGKKTMTYTFNQKLNLSVAGEHTLDIWLSAPGDTYRKNDSILNYEIHNQPLIAVYPYFEDFEKDNGKWYTEGTNNSWEYGTPQSPKINKAASGTKAWKTNLDGNYNNLESSYLYSPCFDISTLSFPTISFQSAMDIENCGIVLCDAAWMDYTTDGVTWKRLDDMKKGINWYDDTGYHIWSKEGNTTWHETRSPLPKGKYTIKLRLAFSSDAGATHEGVAIDDVKVYDDIKVAGNQVVSISPNPTHDGNINIVWAAHAGTVMQIQMTDIMGREVYRTQLKAEESYNQSVIRTSRFASGIYLMRISIGDKISKHKIVYE